MSHLTVLRRRFGQLLMTVLNDDDGVSALEYGLIACLISGAIVSALKTASNSPMLNFISFMSNL